jgi:hypothetical protein
MILRMEQNVTRRLLLIEVTEIVEVTETITILLENDVFQPGQDASGILNAALARPAWRVSTPNTSTVVVITPPVKPLAGQ